MRHENAEIYAQTKAKSKALHTNMSDESDFLRNHGHGGESGESAFLRDPHRNGDDGGEDLVSQNSDDFEAQMAAKMEALELAQEEGSESDSVPEAMRNADDDGGEPDNQGDYAYDPDDDEYESKMFSPIGGIGAGRPRDPKGFWGIDADPLFRGRGDVQPHSNPVSEHLSEGDVSEEEKSEDDVPGQLPGQLIAGAGAPLLAGAPAPGPMPAFSREAPQSMFKPEEWPTGRADRVKGQYWKTFGERKRAVGGGASGFFKALFGKGMARANRAAEKKAFFQDPITRARAWRSERREAGAENQPARSALKTRLAGPPIQNLSTFPREPGVAYDDVAANQAHQGFMNSRQEHHDANEAPLLFPEMGIPNFSGAALGHDAEKKMQRAYADYDKGVGNQTLFGKDPNNGFDDKFHALEEGNRRAGADIFENESRPRRTPQRVRFKDGPDDVVGQPVNDDAAAPENKPMPTSVKFFGAPIGERTFNHELNSTFAQMQKNPEFRELPPEEQQRRADGLRSEAGAQAKPYLDSLGATGHPDEISDEQAMDNAEFAWPVRAQMLRKNEDDRDDAVGRHEVNASNLEASANMAGSDPMESDEFRDQYLRSQVGAEAQRDHIRSLRNAHRQKSKRSTDTRGLGPEVKAAAGEVLRRGGVLIDPHANLAEKMPRLPRNFFDAFLHDGFEDKRQEAARGAAGANGAGGIMEEEEKE